VGETVHSHQRAAIPATASLRVDPERVERMWAMRPADRIQAAHDGRFTLGEMLRWASSRPERGRARDGEFWFIRSLSSSVRRFVLGFSEQRPPSAC
jgi:hypothetical protein